MKDLSVIHEAELRCFKRTGAYVPLRDLRPGGCGGLGADLASGTYGGFRFELATTGQSYAVRAYATARDRLICLYSDGGGPVHIGRSNPATSACQAFGR